MSFQAYLDTIEERTGLTPRKIITIATEKGLATSPVKAQPIIDWLKSDYDLGRGHAMAIVHVIKNGTTISAKHVGTDGAHRDETTELWIDGKATKPSPH
jgi:hypothetical protein